MNIVSVPLKFAPTNTAALARSWRKDVDGDDVPHAALASAMAVPARGVGYISGRMPRVVFQQAYPFTDINTHRAANSGQNTVAFEWFYTDNVPNARTQTVRVRGLTRSGGNANANAYAARTVNIAQRTSLHNRQINVSNLSADILKAGGMSGQFAVHRGTRHGCDVNEGLEAYEGYTILDVVVQDDVVSSFDSAQNHVAASPGYAKPGAIITAGLPANIRQALHEVRYNNQPIHACWSAQRQNSNWVNAISTDDTAIVITTNSWGNLLDHTINARNTATPGISCHAYRAGRGLESRAAGQMVNVICRVKAHLNAAGADAACVCFWGPHGDVQVAIPANAANVGWYITSSSLYLNSAINSVENGIGRNKIDPFGKVANTGTDALRIFGLSIEGKYA